MSLTPEQFAQGMAPVLAVWHKEEPPAATLEVYYRLLAHIPLALFNAAAVEVISVKTYGFPKPSDFIDAAVRRIMELDSFSEGWARQYLDEQRADYLALESGLPRLESGA